MCAQPGASRHMLFFRMGFGKEILIYLLLAALASTAEKQKLFIHFKYGPSPMGDVMRTSLPLADLSQCLAGLFECFHVISNDSEDFCNVF